MGVPQDSFEAAYWYRKAAKQGDEYGRSGLASMNLRFSARSKIWLAFNVLLSALLLVSTKANIRDRQQQKITLIAILILLKVGLDVYGRSHFGILMALSVVNFFYIGKGLLVGVLVATFISFGWAKGAKPTLVICGLLFVAFNIYAIKHYDLRRLPACPRPFYSINGSLVGLAIASAIFLWRESQRESERNDRIAPEAVAGSETEPLRM